MLHSILRFFVLASAFFCAPTALSQGTLPHRDAPGYPELRAAFIDGTWYALSPETLRSHTPWSPDVSLFRYEQTAKRLWGRKRWDLAPFDHWQVLTELAMPLRNDEASMVTILELYQELIPGMSDSEMQPLSNHLSYLAAELARESIIWIELQSWAVTLLADFQLWKKAIPLLLEIEQVLSQEAKLGKDGIKPFFVHLDCSSAYTSLGIRERAIDHLSKAEEILRRDPKNPDNEFYLEHLIQHQIKVAQMWNSTEDLVSILKEGTQYPSYKQLTPATRAWCDFNKTLAQHSQGSVPIESVERSYELVMKVTDPSRPYWESSFEGIRTGALLTLSWHYIARRQFEEARRLHEASGSIDRCRIEFENHLEVAKGKRTINPGLSLLIPHFVYALDGAPASKELTDWVDMAFELRLKAIANSPIMPLGIAGNAHRSINALTESQVLLILREDSGPSGISRALHAAIKRESVGSLARAIGVQEFTPSQVQQKLVAADCGIYELHLGAQFGHGFLIDKKWIRYFRLGRTRDIHQASRKLKKELIQAQEGVLHMDRLNLAIQQMEELLLPRELAQNIERSSWKSILISGFEGASYAPMELLSLPGGERLGDRMPVSYVPSLATAMALKQRQSARDRPIQYGWFSLIDTTAPLAATPNNTPGSISSIPKLRSLPFTPEDEHLLFSNLPSLLGHDLSIGEQSSFEQLGNVDPRSHDVLFIMSHGARDDDLAASPGLLLRSRSGGNTVVGPSDLNHFDAPPLVILIACGTTDGTFRRGDDGVHHLAGTILKQGAEVVLSAHLPLKYGDSKKLSAGVINGITTSGLSPAEALWRTRMELGDSASFPGKYLLHANGLANSPIYPKQEPAAPSRNTWPWIIGLAAGLIGVIIARSHRNQRSA